MTNMMAKTKSPRETLPANIGKLLKRLHYPLDVIRLCRVKDDATISRSR